MSFPHEDSHHANSLWEVRELLETRHPSQYLVFNLSGHAYDTAQLNNQVSLYVHLHLLAHTQTDTLCNGTVEYRTTIYIYTEVLFQRLLNNGDESIPNHQNKCQFSNFKRFHYICLQLL